MNFFRLKTSLKTIVPPKTKTVPNQCNDVNALLNQNIDIIKERNLRNVTTNVTVNESNSEASR